MRLPRLRFSIRWLMIGVALSGGVMAWAADWVRKGNLLVGFEYVHEIENAPLVAPKKVVAIEKGCAVLEDGRAIRIDGGMIANEIIRLDFLIEGDGLVDVETRADGSVGVFKLSPVFGCGNCMRRRPSLVRIPIIPRDRYQKVRTLLGTGHVVTTDVTGGSSSSPSKGSVSR